MMFKSIKNGFINKVLASNGTTNPPKPTPVEFQNPISSPTIQALIADITNWLINIGLAIAVLMLIYGALVFITAGGVEQKVTKGKQILLWSVIGLATLLLAKGAEFIIRSFLV